MTLWRHENDKVSHDDVRDLRHLFADVILLSDVERQMERRGGHLWRVEMRERGVQ